MRTALVALLAVLAVVGVGAAARDHRPAPFGDAVAVRTTGLPGADRGGVPGTLRLGTAASVRFDAGRGVRPGAALWSYRRPGSRPVRLFPLADGTTVALWDDGMLTGIRTGTAARTGDADGDDRPVVGWHRFVPGLADWLRQPRATRGPLLVPLEGGRAFLLPTPELVMTYTTADGSIRTDTLPPRGCAYDPARALVRTDLVVLARPCEQHSTVEAFGPDGCRWQAPAGPLARPVPAGPGAVGVLDVPLLRPRILGTGTGRPLPLTFRYRAPR